MEALFYLFKVELFLLLLVLFTLVVNIFAPARIFKKKRWGWRLLCMEILALGVFTYVDIQPKDYPKTYLKHSSERFKGLSEEAAKNNFHIGTAVTNDAVILRNAKKYFNSITPENALKWGKLVGNDPHSYDFARADSIIDFALRNNLRTRGHVLVWGRAVDFFKSPDLRTVLQHVPEDQMPDTLRYFIKTNIQTLLSRYKGKIEQWDCVNEPLEVFGGDLHNNIYLQYLGKDYIAQSFRWAHEADPNVELYLNEQFDQYDSDKANSFLELAEELVVQGVPIHGVGIQAHAMFTVPDIESFRIFLKRIADLGLKIEITELDARLRLFNSYPDPYQAQGEFYENFCKACIENPACTGITVWGLSDKTDWYDQMGVFKLHMPNESTLFDKDMNAKPAYFGLLNSLNRR